MLSVSFMPNDAKSILLFDLVFFLSAIEDPSKNFTSLSLMQFSNCDISITGNPGFVSEGIPSFTSPLERLFVILGELSKNESPKFISPMPFLPLSLGLTLLSDKIDCPNNKLFKSNDLLISWSTTMLTLIFNE